MIDEEPFPQDQLWRFIQVGSFFTGKTYALAPDGSVLVFDCAEYTNHAPEIEESK